MKPLISWIFFVGFILGYNCQIDEFPGQKDLVSSLPGLTSDVSFKQYSGYLKASDTKFLHYWFVESKQDPTSDPLVLWLNGGPGCSSMEGFLTENGPFRVSKDGVTLSLSPYSWNNVANVLYIESPAGVGYSYSTNGNYTTDDDITADDNYAALVDFLRLFPQFINREFYITGESYAGIYIPMLMTKVMGDSRFGLKGGAIGNGVFNREFMSDSKLKYFYYHGLLGTTIYQSMVDACCNINDKQCVFFPFNSDACQQAVGAAYVESLKYNINQYNINAPCEGLISVQAARSKVKASKLISLALKSAMHTFTDQKVQLEIQKLIQEDESNPPCTEEDHIATWLNNKSTRQALHIKDNLPPWQLCSQKINEGTYSQQYTNMEPFIRDILSDDKLRLLIYNGDLDSVCDFLGDQRFVDSLDLPERISHKSWYYISPVDGTNQVGGFVRQFQQLTFLTVRGSGHMVPTDKPAAAYKMYENFLQNKDF